MQRKILNVYLYRDTSVEDQMCYKMRFIEMQSIENFPEDLDNTMMDILGGMEAPFAACLSDELDKYKDNPGLPLIGKTQSENGGLFKKLRDSYTRKVVHGEQCYIYQDIDMLLHASDPFEREHRGDEQDMFCLLGALDNAIISFRNNAAKDNYDVSVKLYFETPDFNDHLSIIDNAFANANDVKHSLSQVAAQWLTNDARTREESLPRLRYSHAMNTMAYLYRLLCNPVKGKSFGDSILEGWYINKAESTAEKPNPARFFSDNIKSVIKPMRDNDLLSDVKTVRM